MALMQMPAFRAGKVCLSAESGARNGALNVSSWGFSGYRCNLEGALRCQQQACIAELENLPTFSGRVRSLVAPSLQRSRRWGKPIVGDVYGRGGQVSFVEGRNGTLDFRIRAEESTSEAVTDWEPIATAAAASMAAQMLASEDEQATTPESSHADGEDTDGASRHRAVKAQVQTSKRPASKLGGRAQTNGAAAREHLVQDLISGHDHAIPLGRSASRGGPLKVAVDVDEGEPD